MPWIRLSLILLGSAALLGSCAARAATSPSRRYKVIAEYPHDTSGYTQGLVYHGNGVLFESTGRYGHSELRKIDVKSGTVQQSIPLPDSRFGEGLTSLGGKLYQLTWHEQIAYVYDEAAFRLIDSIPYAGEGWGLATDGTSLIVSDGSDSLRFVDPVTFAVQRAVKVRYSSREPAKMLNELEYIGGELFANVYQSDWILRIDPANGKVLEVIDLSRLLPAFNAKKSEENVLNGIAFDPATGHLLVTGKRWPRLFEIKLDRSPGKPPPS
ncbi:MAG: glutaminyl-peptide cyclotransferase [Gemmatimonadales bacterium]